MKVGSLHVIPVNDGVGRVTPAQLFAAGGTAPGADAGWERDEHRVFLDAEGRLEMPLGAFVVESGDRTVLIDAGYGPQAPTTVENSGSLLRHLAGEGIDPGDVTDVVFTHLHADHIGWASVDGVAVFPNATYRCHSRDWNYFIDGAEDENAPDRRYRLTARLLLAPLAARVEQWSGDSTIAPGIDALDAPGHTPGSTLIALSSGTERALLLGDLVHCPAQLVDEDLGRIADVDEALARRTKERIAREIEDDGTPVVGAHFAGLAFGRLLPAQGRRQWVLA